MSKDIHKIYQTEIVSGKCEACDMHTLLVGINHTFFRCTTCGSDLKQYVNGKISYLPIMASKKDIQRDEQKG